MKGWLIAALFSLMPFAGAQAGLIAKLTETSGGTQHDFGLTLTGFVPGMIFLTEPPPAAAGTVSDEVRFFTNRGGHDIAVLISDADKDKADFVADTGNFDAVGKSMTFVEPKSGIYDYFPSAGDPGYYTGLTVKVDYYEIVSDCSDDPTLCRVPEPANASLVALALLGLLAMRTRRR